jgi:DNA mismatch repair protein MLH3
VEKIRSSARVTSLNDVACELLKNALDAGAAHINISVDYGRANCTVEDDGEGILPAEFRENGGLGKHHREHARPPF